MSVNEYSPTTIDEYVAKKVREHGRGGTVSFIDEPEPEPLFCPIISVDDHALEPPDLFAERLPRKFAEQAPTCREQDDGAPWWIVDGALIPVIMANGAVGRPISEWAVRACRFDEFRRGVWDPKARTNDMDLAGVWAQLCFGSLIWGFAGSRFSRMKDPDLGLACLEAYNDWMLEEWCGAAPERYISCQLPWLADASVAAQLIYKNARRGFKAVSFSENPERLGFPNIYDVYWDPFFRACEETGTVVNLHVGSSGKSQVPTSSSAEEVTVALFPVSGLEALIDWVYSGVCLRFPQLKVALSEAGVSWVPMALERLARAYRQKDGVGKGWPAHEISPMEVVNRNFFFTSIEDPSAFRLLDLIGEENVMVETDYPHYDSTWPDCQAMIRSEMTGLDSDTVRKVCYENAARTYGHRLPPDEMIAKSEIGLSGQ